jgi:serine/threonine-protein kinase
MGTVWRAEDTLLHRPVALKLLPEGLSFSPEARRRFVREARSASALDHPSIATLYDAGEEDGRIYLAFALVDGETVRARIRQGPLPVREVARIGMHAADALAHAHARGVIHRDVSSGNIMIARDGRIVLIDFGLAIAADAARITTSRTTVGTVAYLPPEIALGLSADHRSDIYSLGAVLYEMATGRLPFAGERTAAVLYAILNQDPEPPRSLRPDLDDALEHSILRALARDPACRHPQIGELAEELARVADPAGGHRTLGSPGAAAVSGDRPPTSLAVAPFTQVSSDPSSAHEAEVFARGLAETLSASLARVPQLQIVPPGQTGALEAATLRDTARRLGVHMILSGTVRRVGDHLRVSYSLVDGWRGEQVSGDTLDGSAADLFALEDSLLAGVIRALKIEGAEGIPRAPGMTAPAAHEKYLQALGYMQRTDNEGSIDGAIRLLEELLKTEGPSSLVHAALARCYLRKFELTQVAEWKQRAESMCRIALSFDPHSTEVLVTLGRVLMRSGQPDAAVAVLGQALDLSPQSADAWIAMSYAHEARGQILEAEKAAVQAVALRPQSWLTHDRLALARFRLGHYEKAAESWMRAAAITSDNTMVLNNLAAAYFHLGRFEDAVRHYRASLEIAPTTTAYFSLGTLFFFEGRRPEAIAMFEKAVAIRPRDPRAWGNLADAQRWVPGSEAASSASFDRAIGLVREQLAAGSGDVESWSRLGMWLAKRGDLGEALKATERALALGPELPSVRARSVTAFELAGLREKALEGLESALRGGYARMELERDPELEGLRADQRARALLEQYGSVPQAKGG